MPVKIKSLDKKSFSENNEGCTEEMAKNCQPCTASFKNGELNYSITYDKKSGALLILSAWHGESSVTLTVTKFKAENPK